MRRQESKQGIHIAVVHSTLRMRGCECATVPQRAPTRSSLQLSLTPARGLTPDPTNKHSRSLTRTKRVTCPARPRSGLPFAAAAATTSRTSDSERNNKRLPRRHKTHDTDEPPNEAARWRRPRGPAGKHSRTRRSRDV